jgi:hypothetical protein
MSDISTSTWEPLEDAEAAELIGEGIHTGLRKGSEAESSHDLWKAIRESTDGAWSDALTYMVDGLAYMGYKLCTRVPTEDEADVTSGDENAGG